MMTTVLLTVIMIVVGILMHPLFQSLLVISEGMGHYFDILYNLYIFGYILPDYFQCIFGTILRSAGLERKAMCIFMIGFYAIGCPATLLLVFTFDLQVSGAWWGLIIASGSTCLIFYYVIQHIDWDACIIDVRKRVAEEEEEAKELLDLVLENHVK